jgi:hypothetical protein
MPSEELHATVRATNHPRTPVHRIRHRHGEPRASRRPGTVDQAIEDGTIPAVHVGRRVLIPRRPFLRAHRLSGAELTRCFERRDGYHGGRSDWIADVSRIRPGS